MEKCEENNDGSNAISAFDTLYTNNHMKILKLLLPYVDSKHHKLLILYIKWQEFIFTLELLNHYSASLYDANFAIKKSFDVKHIIPLLLPYCTDKERQLLSQFHQMQNMMQMIDGIQEYLPFIQQFMSSGNNDENPFGGMGNMNNINIIDMIKNMLSEEQLAMFSMFMDNQE